MAVITDKTYYHKLGRRIAQQTMAHYEGGPLRVAVALLPPLTHTLDLTLEELVGSEAKAAKANGKRGPAPKIQQQLERVAALAKSEQRVIAKVLDSMLAQSSG